jgi:predicted O-linked N-acetylglucosamine transferase (SPINDLY family)
MIRRTIWPARAPLPRPSSCQRAPARTGPAPDGRLRIGYLSCDFHDHATMYLLAGVLRDHDRSRYAVHAFSYGPDDGGPMRAAARAGVEHFHDIAELTDDQAIALIRSQQIDVLVDLKGFTQGTRSGLLGARLAPVQAAWLGYPGSLGDNRAVDYAIADHVVLPAALRPHFDEKVVWLAGSYQANDDQRPIVPDTQGRAAHGLPEGASCSARSTRSTRSARQNLMCGCACWARWKAACCGCWPPTPPPRPTCAARLRRAA